MEQEQPTMNVSLEEPSEITSPPLAPAAETPPDPPDATPLVDDSLEPEAVAAANGEQYVPLKAVKAERERRKEAENLAKQRDAEIAALKPKAEEFERAKSYLEQARPYIEKARQDLARPAQTTPAVDPALEQYAKDFDLYTAEGKPDVTRAQRIMQFHDDRASKLAQQHMAPLVQHEANRTAQSLYQQYVSRPEVNGIKIDGRLLAEAFNMVGPELIAQNPAVAEVLYQNTIARQFLSGQRPMTAPAPVVPTESLGSNSAPEERLSSVAERMREAASIKTDDYKAIRGRYKAGQSNSLE